MAQAARLASRLQRELAMLQSDPPPGVSAWPCDGHTLTHLQAHIHGPDETVYANGVFKLDIQVPERYPFEPPNIKFITPVYHPNIDNGGRICLDLLNLPPKGAWRPSLNLSTLLASIGLLLAEPNPDDGLMGDISAEYKHDRSSFEVKARKWTESYANQIQEGLESWVSKTPANDRSQNSRTARTLGEDQTEASRNLGEHRQAASATSTLLPRCSVSVSKRLTLGGRSAFLQETEAALSEGKVLRRDSVNPLASPSDNELEETSLHANVQTESLSKLKVEEKKCTDDSHLEADAQSLSGVPIQEEQFRVDPFLVTLTAESLGDWRSPSSTERTPEKCCGPSSSCINNDAANSVVDNTLSSSISIIGSAGCKGFQSDNALPPPPASLTKISDFESDDCRKMPTSGQKRKECVSAEKENRPPKLCLLASSPKIDNPKQLAGDKGLLAECMLLNGATDSKNVSHASIARDLAVKDGSDIPLPSRARSLKLIRPNPDLNTFQQKKAVGKERQIFSANKNKKSHGAASDDAPIIVVSDSGSDSDQSDDCQILCSTSKDLENGRANLRLR